MNIIEEHIQKDFDKYAEQQRIVIILYYLNLYIILLNYLFLWMNINNLV